MTLEANANLLDIEAEHRNDIEAPKLAAFRTSLTNIVGRTAEAYTTLWAWTASNTKAPIEANVSQNQTAVYQAKQAKRSKRDSQGQLHKHPTGLRLTKPGGHTTRELPHRRGPRHHHWNDEKGTLEKADKANIQRPLRPYSPN